MSSHAGRAKLRHNQTAVGHYLFQAAGLDPAHKLICGKSAFARGAPHVDPLGIQHQDVAVNPGQLLELVSALLVGRRPHIPTHSLCIECKRRGAVCVVVAQGIPCLGPVVHSGCGALCPANGRGCYGCFGPSSWSNFNSLVDWMTQLDRYPEETAKLLRGISCHAPAFTAAADRAYQISAANGPVQREKKEKK